MTNNLAFPLQYPIGWERSKRRERSAFDPQNKRTIAQAYDELMRQLRLLGAQKITISTNIPLTRDGRPYSRFAEPSDSGVAVYFDLKGQSRVIACDAWDRVKDNLWAIANDLDALRGRIRWKVRTADQIFEEYKYLPPPVESAKAQEGAWCEVLGVSLDASLEEVERAYRRKADYYHPDRKTGNESMMVALNSAIAQARQTLKPKPK